MTFLQISTVCKKFCFCWSVCSMVGIIIFLYNICKYLISIVFFALIFPPLFFCRLFHHFMEIWSFLLIFSFSWNSKTICPNFIDQKQLYSSASNFLLYFQILFQHFFSTVILAFLILVFEFWSFTLTLFFIVVRSDHFVPMIENFSPRIFFSSLQDFSPIFNQRLLALNLFFSTFSAVHILPQFSSTFSAVRSS